MDGISVHIPTHNHPPNRPTTTSQSAPHQQAYHLFAFPFRGHFLGLSAFCSFPRTSLSPLMHSNLPSSSISPTKKTIGIPHVPPTTLTYFWPLSSHCTLDITHFCTVFTYLHCNSILANTLLHSFALNSTVRIPASGQLSIHQTFIATKLPCKTQVYMSILRQLLPKFYLFMFSSYSIRPTDKSDLILLHLQLREDTTLRNRQKQRRVRRSSMLPIHGVLRCRDSDAFADPCAYK